jgi:hypothetical protein
LIITASNDLGNFTGGRKFRPILADPPWQFQNKTGKVAPEHKRLNRYGTMTLDDIARLPVADAADETATSLYVGTQCFTARGPFDFEGLGI